MVEVVFVAAVVVVVGGGGICSRGGGGGGGHRLRSRQTHHVGKNVRIRAHRR